MQCVTPDYFNIILGSLILMELDLAELRNPFETREERLVII